MALPVIAGAILNFIGGPVIKGIIDGYKAKLEAGNTSDRIAADLAARELAVEEKIRELNAQVVIAEQGRWYTAIIRPLLALPVVIYFWKIIVWDKVLAWGTTDPLTGFVLDWAGWIVVAYVGGRSIEKTARILRR
jgi:hypothetical protein